MADLEQRVVKETKTLNTANAKDQQLLKQDDLFSKRFVYYLASFWSIVSASYIAAVTFIPIPAGNERITDTVLGFLLGTIVATIINYFMGSSFGSSAKTDMLIKASHVNSKQRTAK